MLKCIYLNQEVCKFICYLLSVQLNYSLRLLWLWSAYSIVAAFSFQTCFALRGQLFHILIYLSLIRLYVLLHWLSGWPPWIYHPWDISLLLQQKVVWCYNIFYFFCLKGIVVKFSWNPQHKSELKQNSTHLEIKSNKTFDVSQIYFYISLCNIQAIPFSEWKGL